MSFKIGRARSVATGFSLQVLGLFFFTVVSDLIGIIVCGVLYMLGNAIGSSTTLALAVERADPQRRGKQMATFSVAYPLSYGHVEALMEERGVLLDHATVQRWVVKDSPR